MSKRYPRSARAGRLLAFALSCLLGTLGGCTLGSEPDAVQAARIEPYEPLSGMFPTSWTIETPLRFRVLDEEGHGLGGVRVVFTTRGGGEMSPASAVTDSLGLVAVRLTTGPQPGYNDVYAAADGVAEPAVQFVDAREYPRLTVAPDTLVLPAPGCRGDVIGRLRFASGANDWGRVVDYSVADSSVARLEHINGPGTTAGLSVRVVALKAGETRVVGRYYASSDTSVVRVQPGAPAPDCTVPSE